MGTLISGIFKTRSSAQLAFEDLIRHGYSQDDLSMLMSDGGSGREFVVKSNSKSPEGLSIGAAIGGIIGALVFGFSAVGLVADPDGPSYMSGQWVAGLAGMGAGMLGGGIIGGLIGLSVPEHEALLRRVNLAHGGVLLGVFSVSRERIQEAKKVLDAAGACKITTEGLPADKRRKTARELDREAARQEDAGRDKPSGFTYS